MSNTDRRSIETGLPWHLVEEAINREIEWLERVIEQTVIGKVPGCDDCRYGIKGSSRHGGSWHKRMMDVITEYFEKQGFEVIPEPFLSQGRADLGIHKDGHMDLFIEIGDTSAYKLWWNLQMLTNCKILLVPDEKRAIEFTCRDEGHDILRRP
jgi:hypothetical protein